MLQNYTQEVWKTENKFKFTMLDMIPELTGLIDIQWASLFEIFFKRNAQYDMFFFSRHFKGTERFDLLPKCFSLCSTT